MPEAKVLAFTRKIDQAILSPHDLDQFFRYSLEYGIHSLILQFDQKDRQEHSEGWKSFIVHETLLGLHDKTAAIQAEGRPVTALYYSSEDTRFLRPRDMYSDYNVLGRLQQYGTLYAKYCVSQSGLPARVVFRQPKLHSTHVPSEQDFNYIREKDSSIVGKPIPDRVLRALLRNRSQNRNE